MQITEALISEPGEIRRFVQQAVDHWPNLLAFHFTLYSAEGIYGQQIQTFCSSFHRRYTNVLRSIITRSAHQRRWYYAGCGNNMKEHRYDVCCCSARRVFAIRESASWLMKNVRNWWIYCNRPGR